MASILNEAIKLAGIDTKKFSAKMFRCSGATASIDAGVDAEIVRKLGRWKTSFVFYEHYVHSKTPASHVTSVIPQI